jgi:hypothetical protein
VNWKPSSNSNDKPSDAPASVDPKAIDLVCPPGVPKTDTKADDADQVDDAGAFIGTACRTDDADQETPPPRETSTSGGSLDRVSSTLTQDLKGSVSPVCPRSVPTAKPTGREHMPGGGYRVSKWEIHHGDCLAWVWKASKAATVEREAAEMQGQIGLFGGGR